MQNGAPIGRVLLASLHQAVAEVLPARLEFYEGWLGPAGADPTPDVGGAGLQPGPPGTSLSTASFAAMLDALEHEGRAAEAIAERAGEYAAVRSFRGVSASRRAFLRLLPRRLRARKAVRLTLEMLARLYPDSRVDMTRRRGTVFIGIEGSPFCAIRGAADHPSCTFYISAIVTFLRLFKLRAAARLNRCSDAGARSCLLMVLPNQPRSIERAERPLLGLAEDATAETGAAAPQADPLHPEPIVGSEVATEPVGQETPVSEPVAPERIAPDEEAGPAIPESVHPAAPAGAITAKDRIEIEAQWYAIAGAPASPAKPARPTLSATFVRRSRSGQDPESAWRQLWTRNTGQ